MEIMMSKKNVIDWFNKYSYQTASTKAKDMNDNNGKVNSNQVMNAIKEAYPTYPGCDIIFHLLMQEIN